MKIQKMLVYRQNDFKSYKEKFKEFGVHSFKETGKIEIKKNSRCKYLSSRR